LPINCQSTLPTEKKKKKERKKEKKKEWQIKQISSDSYLEKQTWFKARKYFYFAGSLNYF